MFTFLKHTSSNILGICTGCLFLCALFTISSALAQTGEVTQRVMPVAELSDLNFIASFLEEQFISPEDPDYTYALFFDITRDGFGSNDVLVLYPAKELFQLSPYVPDRMVDVLRRQGLATDYNLSTTLEVSGIVIDEAENEENPKKALAGMVIESVQSYYPAGNVEGYFSRQDSDVRVSFWGYDDDAWQFVPKAAQCVKYDKDPVMIVAHKQPEIRTFWDVDGCVIVESYTVGAQVSSRICR